MSYLIDTNIVFELVRAKPSQQVVNWFQNIPAKDLHLSVLTIGELRKGIEKVADNKKKTKLRFWLEHELHEWFNTRILAIDYFVADRWGRLQAELKRPLPAIDSLIAATALHFDLCLVTRNVTDFQFPSLQLVNPWD